MKLIGPFKQLLTMDNLPLKGALTDDKLEIIPDAGVLCSNGQSIKIGNFKDLERGYNPTEVQRLNTSYVALPGFIDAHTHICWAGSRADDFNKRLQGLSYLEIANQGGGIWKTVNDTRKADESELVELIAGRANELLRQGVTVIEVKSGYGLSTEHELKILKSIKKAKEGTSAELISTCLAAHVLPSDFKGNETQYLDNIIRELLPQVSKNNLSSRVDIFVDKGAFKEEDAEIFLNKVKSLGFDIIIHGGQFSSGIAGLARRVGALSIDHLESANDADIKILSRSDVFPVVLPGSSLGLGEPFAPARKILDSGASLVIASDWNAGSAPMGNLITEASVLAIKEKLTTAEVFSAITYRAAAALKLNERGIIKEGFPADIVAFKVDNYKEILYNQGRLAPVYVWKKGFSVVNKTRN